MRLKRWMITGGLVYRCHSHQGDHLASSTCDLLDIAAVEGGYGLNRFAALPAIGRHVWAAAATYLYSVGLEIPTALQISSIVCFF